MPLSLISYPIYQNPTHFPYKAYLAWYVESTVFSTSLWLHLTLELLSIPSRTVVQRFSIDIYWLTADIYWLTAFLTSSHFPYSSKLFPPQVLHTWYCLPAKLFPLLAWLTLSHPPMESEMSTSSNHPFVLSLLPFLSFRALTLCGIIYLFAYLK